MPGHRGAGSASRLLLNDNWLSLSEAERDEWRGYLDRMLEWLHRFGCTPERNPCSLLLERSWRGADFANEKAP